MLDQLVNDIVLIVYRYIHQYNYREVMKQYNTQFQQYWDDTYGYFRRKEFFEYLLMLNYRNMRDPKCYIDEGGEIFGMNDTSRPYKLPDNYFYSGVWWPNPNTHSKINIIDSDDDE